VAVLEALAVRITDGASVEEGGASFSSVALSRSFEVSAFGCRKVAGGPQDCVDAEAFVEVEALVGVKVAIAATIFLLGDIVDNKIID